MKQIVNGLSWGVLIFALVWCVKSNFELEAVTVLLGAAAVVISTFEMGMNPRKLIGVWTASVRSYGMHYESATVYGYENTFAGVAKILQIPGLPSGCKLYIAYNGDFQIQQKTIHYNYQDIEVIYNSAVPAHMLPQFLYQIRTHSTDEVIHIENKKMMIKTKSGAIVTANRYSKKVDTDYLAQFAEV